MSAKFDPCVSAFAFDAHAERATLAALLFGPEHVEASGFIADYIIDPVRRRIAIVIADQLGKGCVCDEYTIAPHLNEQERAELASLVEERGDPSFVSGYIANMRAAFLLRNLNAIGAGIIAASSAKSGAPDTILDEAQNRLDELQNIGFSARAYSVSEASYAVEKNAIEAKRRGVPPGLRTGIAPVDEIILPLRGGQLVIVAAATSMGKTALATNIAMNLARQGDCVSFFSLEMSAQEIGARILASETRIAAGDIISGHVSEHELSLIRTANVEIASWPMRIEACATLDAGQLIRRTHQHRRKYGTRLAVVDYLGLMRGKGRSFYEQVSDITRSLKVAAGELDMPIIALAQLNREVERRSDGLKYEERYLRRRPKLSDLRDSGSIEQDADVVMFLHREEVYLSREKPPLHDLDAYQDWSAAQSRHRGKADVIVAKQRQGKTGVAVCAYDDVRFRFGGVA